MRFLTALTVGLLASQARVASALDSYTLTAALSCQTQTDVIHFDYALNGLVAPPTFPGDMYEVAYRVTYAENNGIVSVPITAVAAREGTGRSEMQNNAFTTTNKDNIGNSKLAGQQIYRLPGTILHHQQATGVSNVFGYFEMYKQDAADAKIECDATGKPNIALIPLQYTVAGLPLNVVNSYSIITSTYSQVVGGGATAASPIFFFDVTPGTNIDSCYDYIADDGTKNIRVPFRVSKLSQPKVTEKGIASVVVTDGAGNLVPSYILRDKSMLIGRADRDPAEPSVLQLTHGAGGSELFGILDFNINDPVAKCNNGKTNIEIVVLDYSTVDTTTKQQTWHYIPGAPSNGLIPEAQVGANDVQLTQFAAGQLAATATTTAAAPPADKCAARKAAAKAAADAAAAKAAAAKAKAEAEAKAAAEAAGTSSEPGMDRANPCKLMLPANPLSAAGLSTPFVLMSPCTMADVAGFAEATIISPATGQVSVYQPLVIQQGKKALIAPVRPTLPADAVVMIHFGSNGAFQQLTAANANTLTQANCVNGVVIGGKMSLFGQVSACNGAAFYQAAAVAIFQGLLAVPNLGMSPVDNLPCPTVRSFAMIDQDPQDNVHTRYLINKNGDTALFNAKNKATLGNQVMPDPLVNPGDNPLMNRFVNIAFKCTGWMAPDLSNPGGPMVFSNALNELHAAVKQGAPVARNPAGNPMNTDDNGNLNLAKTNAYRRVLCGENAVQNLGQADTATYCKNMVGSAGALRLLKPAVKTALQNTPGPMAGQSTFQFLTDRFAAAVGPDNLNCGKLVPGLRNPMAGGAVIAAAAAFTTDAALLVGADSPDTQQVDPVAELSGAMDAQPAAGGTAFPVGIVVGAVGGVIVLLIASIVIFKVVQRRKTNNVMATTARECKV